jgi:hypothetical protein
LEVVWRWFGGGLEVVWRWFGGGLGDVGDIYAQNAVLRDIKNYYN